MADEARIELGHRAAHAPGEENEMDKTETKPKLLVVEDDDDLSTQMKWGLAADYAVFLAGDRETALAVHRKERPPLVTLDLGLPPRAHEVEEGFETLAALLQEDPGAKIIVITGRDERTHALHAIARGASDYFPKPILMDELKITLRRALHIYELERENRDLQRHVDPEAFERMLGTSPCMQDVFSSIRKVATTEAPVLVMGESGSGKELVARAIHHRSERRDGPFVVINCGAIPEILLESELFGHEKGAFTGAHIQRRGRIESAHGGTLFLDEIGELPLSLQVKLLRFLQEHRIERVGGRDELLVDARVIAATNVDLKQAMAQGRFREDLYYRVGVVVVSVPALRERGDDVALLAKSFLDRFAAETKKRVAGFTPQALEALRQHAWPGNVRELDHVIERAVLMSSSSVVTAFDLALQSTPDARLSARLEEMSLEEAERLLIKKALARFEGNANRAAEALGLSRSALYRRLQKYGLS